MISTVMQWNASCSGTAPFAAAVVMLAHSFAAVVCKTADSAAIVRFEKNGLRISRRRRCWCGSVMHTEADGNPSVA